MPPQIDPQTGERVGSSTGTVQIDPNTGERISPTGQGSSPAYGPDVTVVNPTPGQIGKGVLREGAQLASGAYGFGRNLLDLVPGVKNSRVGQDMQANQGTLDAAAKPANLGEAMGKTGGEMASYLAPAKLETGLAEAAPEAVRPLVRIASSALSNGTMNAANGGDFATGALTGAGFGALSEGARSLLAPQSMRSAIPGKISKDTAAALLEHTSGMRPSSVLESTENHIGQAGRDLETAVSGAPQTPSISLQPAISPVQDALATAQRQRAVGDSDQLSRVVDFLRGNGDYGPTRGLPPGAAGPSPPSPMLTPQEALDARRGYSREFVSNPQWKQVANGPVLGPVKEGYGGLTGELHAQVPGATEADEMMHNLIPARTGLRTLVRDDPSVAGNVMGRVGARTGALTSAAMGAAGGARSAGLPGAILGGITGLTVPEVLSAPAAKIGMARAAFSTATPKIGRAIATPAINSLLGYLRQRSTGDQAQ